MGGRGTAVAAGGGAVVEGGEYGDGDYEDCECGGVSTLLQDL